MRCRDIVFNVKNNFFRMYPLMLFCLLLCMTAVTIALVNEYRFFKGQVQELTELKNNYSSCIQALRRQVMNRQTGDVSFVMPTIPASLKKNKQEGRRFLLVNREKKYVTKEALKFARSQRLEKAIKRLYEKREAARISPKRVPAKRGSSMKASISRVSPKKNQTSSKPRQNKKKKTKTTPRRIQRPLRKKYKVKVTDEKLLELKTKIALLCPLAKYKYWISSPFGPRKKTNGEMGFHAGLDLAAEKGTPVKAAASGSVLQAGYRKGKTGFYKGYGNMVLLQHDGGVKTRYAHLSKVSVRNGQMVTKGQIIGRVGNTGHVRRSKGRDGSHLHWEVYVGRERIDPMVFLD